MTRRCSIVMLVAAALLFTGCLCDEVEKELAECREELEVCKSASAFTLYLEKDAFAMFQPFTNQYRDEYRDTTLPQREFRDGFLVQLGVIPGTAHPWQYIQLRKDGVEIKTYPRGTAQQPWWVDIECGTTTAQPLTSDMAAWLIPDPTDVTTNNRLLHAMFDWKVAMTAVTMWADDADPDQGLTLKTSRSLFPDAHGHVSFHFESKKDCAVRVWSDSTTKDTYTAGQVDEIRVEQTNPSIHGGPHFPGWGSKGP